MAVRIPINGLVPERYFAIRTPVGDVITCGPDHILKYSLLGCFSLMIPTSKIWLVITLTNRMIKE